MPRPLRFALAIIAGIAVALAMLAAVEGFGVWAHPFPAGFGGTHDEICAHVTRYPAWVLVAVIPAWGAVAWASTSVGSIVGRGSLAASLVGGPVALAITLNLWMLPYPWWFRGLAMASVIGGLLIALRKSLRQRASRSVACQLP